LKTPPQSVDASELATTRQNIYYSYVKLFEDLTDEPELSLSTDALLTEKINNKVIPSLTSKDKTSEFFCSFDLLL
jgi:hypothetical protein